MPPIVAVELNDVLRLPHVLSLPLREFPPLWLHGRCPRPSCDAWSQATVQLLAESHGDYRTLGQIVPRLVCRRCKSRPTIILSNTWRYGMEGGEAGWSVTLAIGEVAA